MPASPADPRQPWPRRSAFALLAIVATWPRFGVGELLILSLTLAAIYALALGRWHPQRRQWQAALAIFAMFWLPELLSAPDAVNRAEAWRESALDLRYAPWLLLLVWLAAQPSLRTLLWRGLALIATFWLLDALLQALTGWSLGGQSEAERLSGIFGAGNLKLGWALTLLAPFVLETAAAQRRLLWLPAALLLTVIVLLAGARAAWLSLSLILAGSAWLHFRAQHRLLLAAAATALLAVLAVGLGSERFAQRIERSTAALSGDSAGLDTALSYRLPIWRTAGAMIAAHPINGIGVRGFREAYRQFAPADDHFLQGDHNGAFHAHQWLLEVLSETGVLGLACWLLGLCWLLHRYWRASPAARQAAAAPGLALFAALFPLNTHLATYSTFWSAALLMLLALFAGALQTTEEA